MFNQLVKKLGELGEIEYKNIFIYRAQMEANANKYSFVWKKATNKFEVRLAEKVKNAVEEINKIFNSAFVVLESRVNVKDLETILAFLYEKRMKKK